MSDEQSVADELADAVNAAIGNVLARRGGGMVTAYALVIDFIDSDGDPAWATCYADRQRPATTLGLLHWQLLAVEAQARTYLEGDER